MMRITLYLSIIGLTLLTQLTKAQNANHLDHYVALGLEQNLHLIQQRLELEKSHQDLRYAKGALLPKVDLNARYTRASGGRSFQMPLGDLMNPVYNTLNGLVGESTFETIENQELNFNRTTDVDTRFSIVQPLYNPRLLYQNRIQHELTSMVEMDLSTARRDIVFELKQSYYAYLKALKIKELLLDTKDLVKENQRVSEVLYANDKVTEDAVWRSKTEVRKVDFQIADAEKQYQMAKRYFNQLLNRNMTDSICVDDIDEASLLQEFASAGNFMNREELEKLLIAGHVAHQREKLAMTNNIPNFYFAFDAGYQGSSYVFDSESNYYLASAVMSWNLFSGFKHNAQKQKAKIEQHRLETRFQEVKNSLQLQVEESRLEFERSRKNYETTIAAEKEANANFRIVGRKFEEGLVNQVELIDARTFMTNASAENIIARYDVLISKAAYERATAGFVFNSQFSQ